MYKDAFYHALKDTLVCDNMNHANQIAFHQKQRHRVVTFDGKLIDLSGAIAGGGGSYQRSDRGICAAIVNSKCPPKRQNLICLI